MCIRTAHPPSFVVLSHQCHQRLRNCKHRSNGSAFVLIINEIIDIAESALERIDLGRVLVDLSTIVVIVAFHREHELLHDVVNILHVLPAADGSWPLVEFPRIIYGAIFFLDHAKFQLMFNALFILFQQYFAILNNAFHTNSGSIYNWWSVM